MPGNARSVAVIGLGNLGLAMAANLAQRDWTVLGCDVSSERTRLAEKRGVSAVETAQLAECDTLCFVVPDEDAMRRVLFEGGVLESLTADHLIVSHSTIVPSRVQELAARIADSSAVPFVEAPVSGGADRAERGELTLFAAGPDDAVARARPLLEAESNHIVEVGPIGAGAATKLANQLMMFSAHAALVEAMRMARAYDVSEESLLEALSSATGDTWVGRNWGFFDKVAADYDRADVPRESRPWVKDTAEILEAASDRDLDLPVAGLVARTVADLIESHAGEEAAA